MNRTLKSLAVLKANYDIKKDYLEVMLLYLANLIREKRYSSIEISDICKDFQNEYGLVIPYHPMQTLLQRATKRKWLKKAEGKYSPNYHELSKIKAPVHANDVTRKLENIVHKLIEFSTEKYNLTLSQEQAQNTLVAFLHQYDHEVLFAHKYKTVMAEIVPISRKELYVANQFIKSIFESDYDLYEGIIDLSIGNLLASAILYNQPTKYIGRLTHVDIYLDTRIILRLSGVEGDFRQREYESFINSLKEKGANLRLFQHSYDEIMGIFDDCLNWIENEKYNPKYASPTLKYFFEHHYSKSDIVIFKSKVDSLLFEMDIRKIDVNFEELRTYFIEEQKLYDKIVEVYKRTNYQFKELKMQNTIWLDVKSISAIFRFRKGAKPNDIRNCKSLFLTTNQGLATANFEFNGESEEYDYKIMECITDTFLGTRMWLQSPIQMKAIQEFKIIADCLVAIQPDANLIQKYVLELDKLKNVKKISEDEYYFLKSHDLPRQLLEQKTFGDGDEYSDMLPEEILEEIKSRAKSDVIKAFEEEKKSHQQTSGALLNSIKERQQIELSKNKITETIARIARNIANVATGLLFVVLIPLIAGVQYYQSISPNIGNDYIRYGIGGLLTVLGMLNLYYGFTMKWLYGKIRNAIQKVIENKIFRI